MTERKPSNAPNTSLAEVTAQPTGRDFVKLAWDVRSDPDRAALMQPGDYIQMPVWKFASFYRPVPLDARTQREQGLTGETTVTLREVVRDDEGKINGVVLAAKEDDPETDRRLVDASLFFNYGIESRWPRH